MKLIFCRQYGFRARIGTHTALFELINHLTLDIDKMKVVSGLFLDISKAFDSVDHGLLVLKLESAGIRGMHLI